MRIQASTATPGIDVSGSSVTIASICGARRRTPSIVIVLATRTFRIGSPSRPHDHATDARQLKLRIVREPLDRVHQMRSRRPLVRFHRPRDRFLMRQPREFAEQPLTRPRARPRERGMRRAIARSNSVGCRRGPKLHAGPLDQIREAAPIRFEPRRGHLEQKRGDRGAARLDASRIGVHPQRRVLDEAQTEWTEIRNARRPWRPPHPARPRRYMSKQRLDVDAARACAATVGARRQSRAPTLNATRAIRR